MDIYSAVADSTRRNILELLATSGQLSAREISGRFQISPPAISQHLKVLRESRLVLMEKRAQQRLYQINPVSVNEFAVWVNHLGRKVDERFDRLDTLLESEKKKI